MRDKRAIELDWIIIALIALVFLLGWLTSCNTVHKLYNKQRVSTDSTRSTTIVTNTDSIVNRKITYNRDSVSTNFINIQFNTDTQRISTPVFVRIDTNGTYVINAGYRPIKTITINKQQKQQLSTDSIGLVAVRGIKKYHDTTQLTKSETIIQKSKISSRFPIIIVAGIVALLCLLAVGWWMKSKLKTII